jgi:DNA end-binding protein Ku
VRTLRAVWSGVISFSLVSVPVKLYGATEEKRVSFHQVHRADGARVRYKRVCEADGEELSSDEIGKGFELATGDVVVLTDEDLEGLPAAARKTIAVEAFVPETQIDPILFNKSYYLVPEKLGLRPYALMRDALEASGRVAVVRFAMRERETLAVLRIRDNVMVLESMLWPDEVKEPAFDILGTNVEPKAAELQMANTLIDALSMDWEPEAYQDTYRQSVETMIEAKAAGDEVVTPPAPAETGAQIIDIMEALRASVEAAKGTRSGAGAGSGSASDAAKPAAGAPAKKAAKAAAKKSATPTRAAKGARGTAAVTDLHKPARKKAAAKKTSSDTSTTRRSA